MDIFNQSRTFYIDLIFTGISDPQKGFTSFEEVRIDRQKCDEQRDREHIKGIELL
jgi:hypothetical protein